MKTFPFWMMIFFGHFASAQFHNRNGCNQRVYNTQQPCNGVMYGYGYNPVQMSQPISYITAYQSVPILYSTTTIVTMPSTTTSVVQSGTVSVPVLIRGVEQTISFTPPANAGYTYVDYSPVIFYYDNRCEVILIDNKGSAHRVSYSYPATN